jgi:type II secretory pathway component GspD/PulD (secretin)
LPNDNRRTQEYIVVEDMPSVLQRVADYLAQVDVPPRQVMIEVHILQVELRDDLRHGVNFENMFNVDGNKVTLEAKGFANPAAAQAFFATIDGNNLNALVEALQTTIDAKTLASPRLLVLNGQTATLQVGDRLGYRVITVTETASLETVEFLDVGIVLSVTPRISRDGRIVMNVQPKISTGAVNPDTGQPEEDTTQIKTDVILNDGQGMIIGGLIQERDDVRQTKIPFIGNIWLVGKLFQRSEVNKRRTEIIVALTPHLLPYDLPAMKRHARESVRVDTPLFHGPLHRNPRPEPMLPDANPHRRPGHLGP